MPPVIFQIVGQVGQFVAVKPEPTPSRAFVNQYPAAGPNIHLIHFLRTNRTLSFFLSGFGRLKIHGVRGSEQQLQFPTVEPHTSALATHIKFDVEILHHEGLDIANWTLQEFSLPLVRVFSSAQCEPADEFWQPPSCQGPELLFAHVTDSDFWVNLCSWTILPQPPTIAVAPPPKMSYSWKRNGSIPPCRIQRNSSFSMINILIALVGLSGFAPAMLS